MKYVLFLIALSSIAQAQEVDRTKWKQSLNGTWVQISDAQCTAGHATEALAIEACSRWEAEAPQRILAEEARQKAARRAALPYPSIGMSTKQVRERTSLGSPSSVKRTITKHHVHEQWVYGDGIYLYFDDGVLTALQD